MRYKNDFSMDLLVGQVNERRLGDLLEGKGIEVKTDFMAQRTGNVFVEYLSRGNRSGISTTEAEYYCFFLSERQMILIETSLLKVKCRRYIGTSKDVAGGDNNTSRGILLPISELVEG